MASVNHARAMKRLLVDLKELRESPVPGISAVPQEDNLFEWHCNIVCNQVPFHVVLYLPDDYPFACPSADFLPFGLGNPHGAAFKGKKGMRFCMSILSDYAHIHTDWKKEEGYNWCPGYTVQTTLINIAAHLSEGNIIYAGNNRALVMGSKCADCGHTTTTPFPPLPECQCAGPGLPSTSHDSGLPEISCYISRQVFDPGMKPSSSEDLYGVGLDFRGASKRPCWSSPCELLNLRAFEAMKASYGVVRSSRHETLTHFLPLWLHPNHGECIQEEFEKTVEAMFLERRHVKRAGVALEDIILDSLLNVMATTVEDFCGALEGNNTLLTGFFQLHRLLLWASKTYPTMQGTIDQRIKSFLDKPESRQKRTCPYPEEWLLLLSVTSKYSWCDVAEVYLSEIRKRDVLHLIKSDPRLGDPSMDTRFLVEKSFDLTAKDKKRMALEVVFISVARPANFSLDDVINRLDGNLGFPSSEMEANIRKALKKSRRMKKFSDWYKILKLEPVSNAGLREQLLEAVDYAVNSEGYHSTSRAKNNGWRRFFAKRKRQQAKSKKDSEHAHDSPVKAEDESTGENSAETSETGPSSGELVTASCSGLKGDNSQSLSWCASQSEANREWNALMKQRTFHLKKALTEMSLQSVFGACANSEDNSNRADEPMEDVEKQLTLDSSKGALSEELSSEKRPARRPELSLKKLSSLRAQRRSKIFSGPFHVGPPRRVKSCTKF